ncbi:MAG: hypothetical protein ACHQF0_08285 [Chitinophagales bacterium]
MEKRKYDLEDRLVSFTYRMIDVVEALPNTRVENYIASQLIKLSCMRLAVLSGMTPRDSFKRV